jgi:hypothetical protein
MQRAGSTTGWQIVNQGGSTTPVAYSESDETGYGQYNSFSRIITSCDFPGDANAKAIQVTVYWSESNGSRQTSYTTVLTNWKQ